MLTERVNKRHCGMEEKPTSVLDGGEKTEQEKKKTEKETDFKAPTAHGDRK